MRFRFIVMVLGVILGFLVLLLGDPDLNLVSELPFGTAVLGIIISLFVFNIYLACMHVGRKALLDYIDLERLFKKASETATGSGLATIGVGLICISISIIILAVVK